MSDIPDDIRKVAANIMADACLSEYQVSQGLHTAMLNDIANAITGERERCAKIAENAGGTWSGTRDSHQAVQEAAVDDKCIEIARLIRTPTEGR